MTTSACTLEIMTAKELATLFDYGYWANRKLFGVISGLTTEQFIEEVAGSYGSIRNTLVHIMSTEAGWLERSGGPRRGPKLVAADFPTFASILERWKLIESQIRSFVAALSDHDLQRKAEFVLGDGPGRTLGVGEMLQH